MKIFAAHNPISEIRRHSSSGGVFSILAEQIIKKGGVVYGAAFDNSWNVSHRRIDSVEGLAALRGSKYVFSFVESAYNDAIADLKSGRYVLFSGTPCQVAAMRKRAGDNPHLLLVEIICHGAPKKEYWTRYLSELCHKHGYNIEDIVSVNFRDKRTGWKNYSFTIIFSDGKTFTQSHDDNIYMRAFLKDLTLREACFKCPFKYPDGSKADITLGDLWGISQLAPEIDNDLGTTLVIVKDDTSFKDILNSITPASDNLSYEMVAKANPALFKPAVRPSKYFQFASTAQNKSLIPTLKKFASKPIVSTYSIYLLLARIKRWIMRKAQR